MNEIKFFNLEGKSITLQQVPFISGRIADAVEPLLEELVTSLINSPKFYSDFMGKIAEKQKELELILEVENGDGTKEYIRNEDATKQAQSKAMLDVLNDHLKSCKGNTPKTRIIYFEIAKLITDKKQLTSEWLTALNDNEIWQEQNLKEVEKYVDFFRESYDYDSSFGLAIIERLQKFTNKEVSKLS